MLTLPRITPYLSQAIALAIPLTLNIEKMHWWVMAAHANKVEGRRRSHYAVLSLSTIPMALSFYLARKSLHLTLLITCIYAFVIHCILSPVWSNPEISDYLKGSYNYIDANNMHDKKEFYRVVKITASAENLTAKAIAEIPFLSILRHLDFTEYETEDIPLCIVEFVNLETITIKDDQVPSVIEFISKLTQLKKCYVISKINQNDPVFDDLKKELPRSCTFSTEKPKTNI